MINYLIIKYNLNPLILFFIFLSSFIVLYLILTYQIKQQAKKELKHETKEQLEKELKIIQDEIFIYEQQLALVKKERKTPFLSRDSKIEYITKENFLVSQVDPLKEYLTYLKYKLKLLEKKK